MLIEPLLILDERDLQPYINELQKQHKIKNPLEIKMIVAVHTVKGWRVEIQTDTK